MARALLFEIREGEGLPGTRFRKARSGAYRAFGTMFRGVEGIGDVISKDAGNPISREGEPGNGIREIRIMRWFLRGENMDDTQHYRRLRRNMVLVILAVSIVPMVFIGGITGQRFHAMYRERVLGHLQEMVEKHNHDINGFLTERRVNIRFLARAFDGERLADEIHLERLLRILQEEHRGVFVDLGFIDENGIQAAYVGPFRLSRADYSDALWFREAMETPSYVSEVFLGLRGLPHFIVATKLEWRGRPWILRSTIDFVAFNNLVENFQMGETGQAFIVNRKGDFQTRPRMDPVLIPETYDAFLSDRSLEAERIGAGPGQRARIRKVWKQVVGPDRVAILEKESPAGRPYLCVMTALKGGEWILVYQQETRDAFSRLYRTRNLVLSVLIAGGVLVVLASVLLSRRMVFFIERADREKEMMNEQVIEAGKLASVGELAAGIAHEINNPVAIMVEEAGWMEDLLADPEPADGGNLEEFQRALKQIRTQGSRCKEITHKLLSFARRTSPDTRVVPVNEMVEEVVGLSEQKARYGNVKISLLLSDGLPPVKAAPSEIQQVLMNLINNAIDAIEKKAGGTVEVTTRAEKDRVVVSVADNGPGIARAILPRIFDPFFTTKPVGKGTGLGLSICYGIVRKMGGEISVNSVADVGTTFHVRIPAADGEEVGDPDGASNDKPAGKPDSKEETR
jgi:two-component system, NtrC family, sensor kinase